ncbi:MAG: efflux RND transporter periplasmic adaptor subunit [Tissierellia bacterium]|nr:efflux RND transporter periplasmic adaptor subunit [Tissierellia bacterium]MDD4726181.1 efflux RND transporter periplasmic adaptor subunit [Tissierellia bacterium]
MKKKIIFAIIVIVILGIVAAIASQNSAVEVNAEEVIKGNISSYVEEIGEVKTKDYVNIYSPTSGKVVDVMVDIGDAVKVGDLLVRLDGEDIARMIEDIDAQKSSALAQYNEAKKPVDDETIEKQNIEINNIETIIENAEKELKDKEVLLDAGAISSYEYESAVRNLDFEKRNLEKARLDLQQLSKPVSSNILTQYEAQLKQLDLQKQSLMDSGKDFTITSTIEGVVLFKDIDEGSYLQPGMHVLEIGNTNSMYIEADILTGDIVKFEEGSQVVISSDDLGLTDIKGQVTKIHPRAFSKISDLGIEQKRIKVEIQINEIVENIKPGYELDLKIITDKSEDTLLAPENAVFDMEGKDYVFTIIDSKAILTQVKTGIESQRQIEILDGIEEGQIIILSPDNEIEDGIKVKINS